MLAVGETSILAVVSPVFQRYVVPPVAVSVVDSPKQIEVSSPAFAATSSLSTVTITSSVASQLFAYPVTE